MKLFLVVVAATLSFVELFLYSFSKNNPIYLLGRLPYRAGIDRIEWNSFIDLRVITDNGYGCGIPIDNLHVQDCYFNATNVPLFLIKIARFLHISGQHSNQLGFLLGSTAIIATTLFLASCLWAHPVIMCLAVPLVLFSYPMRLALERGNIDLFVLVLLVASVQILALLGGVQIKAKKFAGLLILALALVLFASLSKVYPIILFAIFSVLAPEFRSPVKISRPNFTFPKQNLLRIVCLLLGCFIFAWEVAPSLFEIAAQTPKDMTGGWSYGFMTIPEAHSSIFSQMITKVIFIAFSALLFFHCGVRDCFSMKGMVDILRADLRSESYGSRLCAISLVSGSFLLAFTYFPFVNTYYRIALPLTLIVPFIFKRLFAFRGEVPPVPFAFKWIIIAGIIVLLYCGYRAMVPDLQHYSNVYLQLVLQPFLVGFFQFLSMAALFRRDAIDGCHFRGV